MTNVESKTKTQDEQMSNGLSNCELRNGVVCLYTEWLRKERGKGSVGL